MGLLSAIQIGLHKASANRCNQCAKVDTSLPTQPITLGSYVYHHQCFITTATVAPGLYTSRSIQVIKEYLENEALAVWTMDTIEVDNQGAISAEVMQGFSCALMCFVKLYGLFSVKTVGRVIQVVQSRLSLSTAMW